MRRLTRLSSRKLWSSYHKVIDMKSLLELIAEGQRAREEGRHEDFLSLHPEIRRFIEPEISSTAHEPEPEQDDEQFRPTAGIFEHYLGHLERKFGGKKKGEKIKKIRSTVEATARRLAIRQPQEKRSGYGLVIGRIQRGKTAHMFGLALRSIDSSITDPSYDTVIILSGLTNDLRLQTRDRISNATEGFVNPPKIVPPRNVDLKEQDDSRTKELITDHLDKPESPMLVVIKKNHLVLGHLLEAIESSDSKNLLNRRILIIDDEADHASIDTGDKTETQESETSKDNPSETNRLLRKIIKKFTRSSRCWYVGYTATPFANLLIQKGMRLPPNQYGLTLHPRDMLHALPKPDGHLDNEQYFLIQDSPHVLIRDPVDGFSDEEKHEMREILLRHVITSFIKRDRGIDGHHTTLVHTDTERPEHKRIAQMMRNIIEDLCFHGTALQTSNSMTRILGEYESELSPQQISNARDFIDIVDEDKFDRFTGLLDSIVVAEVNSRPREPDEESPMDLDYSRADGLSRSYVAVGGTRLSRGLTLEGLTTSWFTRRAKTPKYDTMLQMARWCGYRTHFSEDGSETSYADLVRIITTADIRRDFVKIGNEELNIRNRIESLPEDTNPLEQIIWIREHPGLHITSPDKIRDVIFRTWGGVMKSVIWSYHSPLLGKDAPQYASKLFNEAENLIINAQSFPTGPIDEGFSVFREVPWPFVSQFLEFYAETLGKCSTRDDLKKLITSCQESKQPWDVAIHMPDRKKFSRRIGNLEIGLVNRSRDHDDESRFKIIQNRSADTKVGLPSDAIRARPMLLLYLVDPASTKDDKGVSRVFDSEVRSPIPIFGISLAPPNINEGGTEVAAGE